MAVAIRRLRERKARRKAAAGKSSGPTASGTAKAGPDALREMIAGLPEDLHSTAFSHASWVSRRTDSYGRLAFLGDSVLGLAVAEYLYSIHPAADIGRLTKLHGQAVSGRACAEVALSLGVVDEMAKMAPGPGREGIDMESLVASERVMASVCESVIGACYFHYGLERTADAVLAAFASQIELASREQLDHKSALQEALARAGNKVVYRVLKQTGPAHARRFRVAAEVEGEHLGEGEGGSKKAAEQAAAAEALRTLRDN